MEQSSNKEVVLSIKRKHAVATISEISVAMVDEMCSNEPNDELVAMLSQALDEEIVRAHVCCELSIGEILKACNIDKNCENIC